MRVIYVNDNSVLPHVGCRAVTDAHDRIFGELRLSVALRLFKNDLFHFKAFDDPSARAREIERIYGGAIRGADAVIANGEGTLHHGRGQDIMSFLGVAQEMGKPTFLINALVQDVPGAAAVIGRCAGVAARDPASLREAARYHPGAVLIPDSIGHARFAPFEPRAAGRAIIATDSLGKGARGARYIIDRFLAETDAGVQYFPLQDAVNAEMWRQAVNIFTAARCVVSARHHGCYLAALAGRPFVALESNSHKMPALREMFGAFVPFVTRHEDLSAAIECACDHAAEFAALRDRLLHAGFGDAYARLLGAAALPAAVPAARPGRLHRVLGMFGAGRSRVPRGAAAAPGGEPDAVDVLGGGLAASYGMTLLGMEKHGDSRLKPLRAVLRALARQTGTCGRHKAFWDFVFTAGQRRPFLIWELAAIEDDIRDGRLRKRIRAFADSPGKSRGWKFSKTLREFDRNPGLESGIAHLKNSVLLNVAPDVGRVVGLLTARGEAARAALFEAMIPALFRARRHKEVVAVCDTWRPVITSEDTLLKIATSYDCLGRHAASVAFLEQIHRDADAACVARLRIGRVRIRQSRYQEGWALLAAARGRSDRWETELAIGLPEWDGTGPEPRSLLIWIQDTEGIGGEIVQSRILPAVPRLFRGKIGLATDARLATVFAASFPRVEVLDRAAFGARERARYDAFAFSRSLMGRVIESDADFRLLSGARLEAAGAHAPLERCLRAAPARMNVAISWMTTNKGAGAARNVPPELLAECLARHPCNCFPIQHGDVAESVAVLQSRLGGSFFPGVVDPYGSVEDIGRALRRMDAVITIENSLLHMAGAFGVKCLGLLPIPCSWVWPASGRWSRWYDSVDLLRQLAPGHWAEPLRLLDESLARLGGGGPTHPGGHPQGAGASSR